MAALMVRRRVQWVGSVTTPRASALMDAKIRVLAVLMPRSSSLKSSVRYLWAAVYPTLSPSAGGPGSTRGAGGASPVKAVNAAAVIPNDRRPCGRGLAASSMSQHVLLEAENRGHIYRLRIIRHCNHFTANDYLFPTIL